MPEVAGRDFFATGAKVLARRLLGCTLVRVLPSGERLAGRIVETEAYLGVLDRGSHTFGNRRTLRNESMYGQPGTAYVYFTYGMHHCVNIVAGKPEEPVAVLLRALEPLEGLDQMAANRNRTKPRELCSGPGKLCQALAIDRSLDRTPIAVGHPLSIEVVRRARSETVASGPRIGLSCGGEWAAAPLRFWLPSSRCVSGEGYLRRGLE